MSKKATTILKNDHSKVEELLDKLVDQREDPMTLLQAIEKEIKIHSHVEEKIFYPAYREAVDSEDGDVLIEESLEEHEIVEKTLSDMRGLKPDETEFRGKASVLKEMITHHAGEEEDEMFPHAEKVLGEEELYRLGDRIEKMKQEYKPDLKIKAK